MLLVWCCQNCGNDFYCKFRLSTCLLHQIEFQMVQLHGFVEPFIIKNPFLLNQNYVILFPIIYRIKSSRLQKYVKYICPCTKTFTLDWV